MPPTLEDLRERARPWAEPVPGAAPAGVQAKHEPAYEAVATEVAKLESPASNAVRWDFVVDGAGALLKGTTKDLWLASYVAYGLYATRGVDGAATGAILLAEVTERYWPDLFPELKRLRGRANAVGWFVERLGKVLPSVDQGAVTAATMDALAVAVKRLSQLSRERFADAAPAFGPLQDAIARLRAGLPEPAPEPEPTPAEPVAPPAPQAEPASAPSPGAAPASTAAAAKASPSGTAAASTTPARPTTPAAAPARAPAQTAPAPAAAPVEVPSLPALPATPDLSSAEAVTDFLRTVGTALLGAAGALRRASPSDPLPYRLQRMGLWLHLARPPAAGANGRTPLQPLPEALRTKLQTLESNQRWADLLDESESALGQHRFALGLHRFSAAALTGLGDSHAAARAMLLQELGIQLRRMPGVEELVAANGSPLTDDATRAWLRAEVIPASTSTTTGAPGVPTPVALSLPALALTAEASSTGNGPALEEEARALLAEGRVAEAVARLQAAVSSASTGRARFLSRLALARLCANAGQLPLARAVYDALDEEVTAHALDTWEPALAAACLEGWLSTRTAAEKEGGPLAAKVRNRYRRLARLDSSAALRVGA